MIDNPAVTRDNMAKVLTEILRSGSVQGRVRLQKMMFLLKQRRLPELQGVDFSYHHYGPFSALVMDVLEGAVGAGLIEENRESFDEEWQRFVYSLKEAGERIPRPPSPSLGVIRTVVDACQERSWRSLELAATVEYLLDRGFSESDAWTRALKLKPACVPSEAEARALLEGLPPRQPAH